MDFIQIEQQDRVAVLTLNRGVTNPINLQLLNELTDTLKKAKESREVHSLVLCSANDKFFSIGLDIPQLFDLSIEDFTAFYKKFNQVCRDLYTIPKPTIAVVTGHAIAGGCILALCCDYRFIADGKKLMGLNEVKLGVPVPYPADCILRDLVGTQIARDIMYSGEFYKPEELLEMGIIDQVLPLEEALPRAIEKAKQLGSSPQEAFRMIKRNRIEPVEQEIGENLDEREKYFIECWYSAETCKLLKEAIEKF